MKKLLLISIGVALLAACDHIAEGDQLIKVGDIQPVQTSKNVLLEDFTGQRCSNCPLGTQVIEQLKESYGERLIPVGIHSGPLGFKGTPTIKGLATDTGDEYYNHWGLEYQPVGLVNRHGAVNYTDWAKAVRDEMSQQSCLTMSVSATLAANELTVTVGETAYADFTGQLQVWLLEDGITAIQTMPDGSNNREYVHNHVFRAALNGTWGQPFTIKKGDNLSQTITQSLDASWVSDNLSVVAFVYNDSGVEQCIHAEVQ